MLDHHLHVWSHGPGTPTPTFEQLERYCHRAVELGISQIAITEHSYRFDRMQNEVVPHWQRPTSGPLADATSHIFDVEGGGDLDTYVAALVDAQQAGLPLLIGLEVDYWPGAMEATSQVLDDYPFDILLGSVHWLDEWLFDAYDNEVFAAEWNRRDIDDVYSQYVESVLDMARSGIVDVIAHVDVIKVAGHRPENPEQYERRLAEGIAQTGVAVELSSGGLRKPADDTYPGASLLDRFLELGVPLTTAADGHNVDQIGLNFDRLRHELDHRGITELITFDRRTQVAYHR